MKKEIRVMLANPSGNRTIFVMDPCPREEYQVIARQLLDRDDLKGEQVGFATGLRSMEMCGLEFCGNATRAYAYCLAKIEGREESQEISMTLRVSGTDQALDVNVDTRSDYARTQMPRVQGLQALQGTPIEGLDGSKLVDLGGIMHVVTDSLEPSLELFGRIRSYIMKTFNPAAMGVIFLEKTNSFGSGEGEQHQIITPIVYVRDVDSTYEEGSCASGSEAAAVALSQGRPDGSYRYVLHQPAGVITASVEMRGGRPCQCSIEGPVTASPMMILEVEV